MLIRNDYKPRMPRADQPKNHRDANEGRLNFIWLFLCALPLSLLFGAMHFYLTSQSYWQKKSNAVFVKKVIDLGMRGRILDRNYAILAISEPVADVIIDPYHLPDFSDLNADSTTLSAEVLLKKQQQYESYQQSLLILAELLDQPYNNIKSYFDRQSYLYPREKNTSTATHHQKRLAGDFYLSRNIDKLTANQIEQLHIQGLKISFYEQRRYPEGALFAQLIGIVKTDNDETTKAPVSIGLEGLEYAFNNLLRGRNGTRHLIRDNHDNYIAMADDNCATCADHATTAKMGEDLVLSIDKNIQYIAQEALKKAITAHKADKASAVVLDAKTGEILAIANYPSFDPDDFTHYKSYQRFNHAAFDAIEPGSAFKPFIVAKALDEGKVTPNTVVNTMPYNLAGKTISDTVDYPQLSVSGIIQKSSNVGVSHIAAMLPPEDIYDYLYRAGFGHKTNANLPDETKGILHPWQEWSDLDRATISYGYGVQVSLLQLARSYTMFTNDGKLLPVSILKLSKAPQGERIISAKTASQIRQMMSLVTEAGGTGRRGAVPGYDVAAKSGTIRMIKNKAYSDEKHRALFAGFAPVNNPRVIVAVSVENPKINGYYGGIVAAVPFAAIISGTLTTLGVPTTRPLGITENLTTH